MGIFLIIALFVANAFALNFIGNQSYKLASMMNVISLCLTVAVAYQFGQINSIISLFLWLLAIAAVLVFLWYYLRKK